MYKDEIITEVWKNRDAYAERFQHDLDKMIHDLRARQAQSDTPDPRR